LFNVHLCLGPTLSHGIPPFIAGNRSSASVPTEEEHATCGLRPSTFFVANFPEVSSMPNAAWTGCFNVHGIKSLTYRSEEDIVHCVRNFVASIIAALGLNLDLGGEIGIKHIRPDICALLINSHLVGVIEVKLPGEGILLKPTVVGELYDQMMLVSEFYGTGPVIGILTSGREWMICWFPEDDAHFRAPLPAQERVPGTPVRTASREQARNSPPGGTPSQQRERGHQILQEPEVDSKPDDDACTEEAPPRALCASMITDDDLLQTLCTALTRMSLARAKHYDETKATFMFKLRKDVVCLTWHPISYNAINERLDFDKFPRSTTKTLFAVEDLGRGASGKCWLCATTTRSHAAVCVLKYRNRDEHSHKLAAEFNWWVMLYPEFKTMTRVERWCGSLALLMPHFATIPEQERNRFKEPLKALLNSKFLKRKLVHVDVRWRNIGSYKDAKGEELPVVYDLEGVRHEVEGDKGWVDKAIALLFPTNKDEFEIDLGNLKFDAVCSPPSTPCIEATDEKAS
jgi:hypothetical protein